MSTPTCENRVIHLRRSRQFICGRPAVEYFDGKHRCERHLSEAKKRARQREQFEKEREHRG